MINIKESKSHVIFGSLLIIFGIGVFIFPYIYNQYQEKQEELKIEQFFYKETSKEENKISNKQAKPKRESFLSEIFEMFGD